MPVQELVDQTFREMIERDPTKYSSFLFGLRAFKYLGVMRTGGNVRDALRRGRFLETMYVLMRRLDDIVDGDSQLPEGYNKTQADYIEEKMGFFQYPSNPEDEIEELIIGFREQAREISDIFYDQVIDNTYKIMTSLLFDAKRKGEMIIFNEDELLHHFHSLDIQGTIRAALLIFNEDPRNCYALEPLGRAVRIYYNLRDFSEDFIDGYVNFSKEDYGRYSMNIPDLKSTRVVCFYIENDEVRTSGLKGKKRKARIAEIRQKLVNSLPRSIRSWYSNQAHQGLALLEDYRDNIEDTNFGWLTQKTLSYVFERPAEQFFQEIRLLYSEMAILQP
ncbi:MAG: hypothetical protein V1740_07595 [Candidatus Woesearchaeota archaeon]